MKNYDGPINKKGEIREKVSKKPKPIYSDRFFVGKDRCRDCDNCKEGFCPFKGENGGSVNVDRLRSCVHFSCKKVSKKKKKLSEDKEVIVDESIKGFVDF